MDKKYQIFVSSTYMDLVDERQDALKAIIDLGHIASGMEGFFATDQEQLTYIKRVIDECDYYVLVIAGRYGSMDGEGISYTEREYEYALAKEIPILAFIHNDTQNLPASKVDLEVDKTASLARFRSKVEATRIVSHWNTREQLQLKIMVSILKATVDTPRVGWVRANVAATQTILAQLNDIRNEAEELRLENGKLKRELKPRVRNLASLEEAYKIKFTYYSRTSKQRYDGDIDLTWSAIFQIVGPSFFSPASQQKFDQILDRYIEKVSGKHMIWLNPGVVDTIKIQAAALGLMDIYSAQSTSGGQQEFISLTEYGKKILLEIKTVKNQLLSTNNIDAE